MSLYFSRDLVISWGSTETRAEDKGSRRSSPQNGFAAPFVVQTVEIVEITSYSKYKHTIFVCFWLLRDVNRPRLANQELTGKIPGGLVWFLGTHLQTAARWMT